MIATLVGCIFIVVGLWGISEWFGDFVIMAKGFVPVSLVLGGLVALVSGLSSMRKPRGNEKPKE